MKIEMSGNSFHFIMKSCSKATDKNNVREALRYIELRAEGGICVATALNGFIMHQARVGCKGKGVILIPGNLKTERAEWVTISVKDSLHIKYFDEMKNLLVGYELPKYEGPFVDWRNIPKNVERPESVIHCDSRYLRKILAATAHAEDQIISISIPEDKGKNILIASNDFQGLCMPVRVMDVEHKRGYQNWFKEIEEA